MVKIGIVVFGLLFATTVVHAQTIGETLATPATVVDIGVEYSCRQTEQRGWIRYAPGILPTADVIQTDAKTRLCAQIGADYVAAGTTFALPDGLEFPLRVDVMQKGIAGGSLDGVIMGTAEIICP